MAIKALLIDIDGVLLHQRDRYFSETLQEYTGAAPEDILPFFQTIYPEIAVGKRSLEVEIEPMLSQWNWTGDVLSFLEFWYSHEGAPHEEVIAYFAQLRKRGLACYLASDHTDFRARQLETILNIRERYDGAFFSCHLGHTKGNPAFYKSVLETISLSQDEILFIDDDHSNAAVAKGLGIQSIHYIGLEKLQEALKTTT